MEMNLEMAKALSELASAVKGLKEGGQAPGGWPGAVYKHTVPTGTPSTPYVHGPGGLFGVLGLDRDVISTRVQPRGLASFLPVRTSPDMIPYFPYITGFLGATGSNADGVCDEPQTAGPMKTCIQTAQFGRYSFNTRELELNRVGQKINRGEFFDLRLVNDPLVNDLGSLFPTLASADQAIAGREMLERMLEVGVEFQDKLLRQVYTGNPANNSAGGGYKEFPGLDILIGTTKVDAITGTDCPSLYSDIKNFAYGKVDADNLNPDIVEYVTYLAHFLRHNAETMNFGDTRWVIVMRQDLFYELTAVWPCSYLTYRCQFRTTDGTTVNNVNAADQVAMRDAMRNGRYLLIDGQQYPVVIDDGITEESSGDSASITAGCYASDIYFVPMTVRGGYAVTYWEVFDYADSMRAAADARLTQDFWTDGGRYMWTSEKKKWCVVLTAKIEPRIILRTPQLAGRIQNVQYCPMQHVRESIIGDPYNVNGGVSVARAEPTHYSEWNLPS